MIQRKARFMHAHLEIDALMGLVRGANVFVQKMMLITNPEQAAQLFILEEWW
jgi:hypothetical protein